MEVAWPGGDSGLLSIDQLRALEPTQTVPSGKLAGCVGISVQGLLQRAGAPVGCPSGIFTAADGLATEPIAIDELTEGLLLHSDSAGDALPQGGPLRIWYPEGMAVQKSMCGSTGPVNVKGVVRLTLQEAAAVAIPALQVELVYRLSRSQEVAAAVAAGVYTGAPPLDANFIHLSTGTQARRTAALYFAGSEDLMLLAFTTAALAAAGLDLRWEDAAPQPGVEKRGGDFPHLYGGPIPMSCLVGEPMALALEGSEHVFPEHVQ